MTKKTILTFITVAALGLMTSGVVSAQSQQDVRARKTAKMQRSQTQTTSASSSSAASSSSSSDEARRQGIRDALSKNAGNDNIITTLKKVDDYPEYLIQSDGTVLRQVVTKKDVDAPQAEFVPIDASNIYPGCIVYADDELIAGKPREVDFGVANQMGTVTVYVDFQIAGDSRLSEKNVPAQPDDINAAIGRLLQKALKNGVNPAAEVQETNKSYSSVDEMAIDLGVSADFLSVNCKVNTKTTTKNNVVYSMDTFKQAFYTVYVEPENKDKTNYFGTGVTATQINNAYKNHPLAIITSVTYGRRGYYKKEYSSTSFTFKGNDTISYKKNSLYSAQDITKTSTSTSQYGYVYGGSSTTAGASLSPETFSKSMKSNMEFSMKNQGKPISYTVMYLASGTKCTSLTTGQIKEVSYAPAINELNYKVVQDARVLSGTNSVCMKLFGTVEKINPATGTVVGTREVALLGDGGYDWSNNNDMSKTYSLEENEYFKGNRLRCVLRTCRAKGQKWNTSKEGWVDITEASNGLIQFRMTGSYYSGIDLDHGKITRNGQEVGNYVGFIGDK